MISDYRFLGWSIQEYKCPAFGVDKWHGDSADGLYQFGTCLEAGHEKRIEIEAFARGADSFDSLGGEALLEGLVVEIWKYLAIYQMSSE